MGRSTFLLGADPKLSGEGVFNGIYYCPLGFRATCTCISLCTGLVILTSWLRASNLSIVNSDWLKNLVPVFQSMRSKTKTNRTLYASFLPPFENFTVNCLNFDWFIALLGPVIIGQSNLVLVFSPLKCRRCGSARRRKLKY